ANAMPLPVLVRARENLSLFPSPKTRARRAGAGEEENRASRRAAFPAFAFHGAWTRAGPVVRIILRPPSFASVGIEGHGRLLQLGWFWLRSPQGRTPSKNDTDF